MWETEYADPENKSYYDYDYAFGITEVEATCECLDYKILSDLSKEKVRSFGYPANFSKGEQMVTTEGNVAEMGNRLKMPNNPMRGGASGGAWVLSGTNTVVSLNSTYYKEGRTEVHGPKFTKRFESLLEEAMTFIASPEKIRYFRLKNKDGVVARMQIIWTLGNTTKGYEESGYHDICALGERTIDMVLSDVPDGATVQLKAKVMLGKNKTASEKFIYSSNAAKTAYYELSGTSQHDKLTLLNT